MDFIAIIVAIIFAALSLFNGREENKKTRPTSKPIARRTPTSEPTYEVDNKPIIVERKEQRPERSIPERSSEKNYENNLGDEINGDVGIELYSKRKQKKHTTSTVSSISMSRQLNKKRMIESLIMNEVLGPPKAHKPFRHQHYRK